MLDQHEHEVCLEEQVIGLYKIASPDGLGMIVEKGSPGLPVRTRLTNSSHITLDGAFADGNTQFQQFASDALGSPQPVFADHAQNEYHRFKWQPGIARRWPGFASPHPTKQVSMPAQQCSWLDNQQGLLPGSNLAREQ